jgi:lysophospholipase L1-like esterase
MLHASMKSRFRVVLFLCIVAETMLCIAVGTALYRRVLAEKQKKEVVVVPVKKENITQASSWGLLYFFEPSPNVNEVDTASWLPSPVVYTINEDALNDQLEYDVQKPADTFRIIALGDSFTFGHYVNTSENWPARLEDMLNAQCADNKIQRIEVLNLGVRGYDVKYIAHRYAVRGKKYNPDLVIWLESGSGFTRISELYEPLVRKYDQVLSKSEKDLAQKTTHDYYLAWTRASEEVQRTHSPDELLAYIHEAWLDFFNTKGDTMVVIASFSTLAPGDKSHLTRWVGGQKNTDIYTQIPDLWSHNGVLEDGHPSTHGHTIIAQEMLSYLKERGIVRCQ